MEIEKSVKKVNVVIKSSDNSSRFLCKTNIGNNAYLYVFITSVGTFNKIFLLGTGVPKLYCEYQAYT